VAPDTALAAVLNDIRAHYTACARQHGSTPRGVDWTSLASQQLRFVQLMKICTGARAFSLNDAGCGYGALLDYLAVRHADADIDYLGYDVAPTMVQRARRRFAGRPSVAFAVGHRAPRIADCAVASGIFNVQRAVPITDWERFVAATLADLWATTRIGFAVNFMHASGPGTAPRAGLYQPPPRRWIDHCTQVFGARVELLEGYGQPEVTMLVRHG
jgi:SAM-dependent methyltransferase